MSGRRRASPPVAEPRRRRSWWRAVIGAVLLGTVALAGMLRVLRHTASAPPTSVLLVTIDTLRADHVGAYGARTGATPHLDALAARGALFEDAVTSAPLTLPAHASILSGLEPPHHGVRVNGRAVFPADRPTLATVLQARGYATGAFVAAYVLDRRFGLARGFDVYDDRVERRREGASVLESERPCTVVAEAAERWLAQRTGPFFAWVHFYEPHAPYEPPPAFRDAQPGRPYDGEIAAADACLGRVLAAAESRGADRLLSVVMADHGEALGDHGELTHGFFVYQPTVRIPMVMAGPGVPAGRRPALARAVDVLPTVLARVAAQAPSGLDGADLFAAARGDEAYAETLYPEQMGWAGLRALRRGRTKYIDAPRPELYDLAVDPGEARNLAADRPPEIARAHRTLDALRGSERASAPAPSDPAVAEKLRALGYVAGPAASNTAGPRLDPKDAIGLWRLFEDAIWKDARGEHDAAVAALSSLVRREPANAAFRQSLAAALRLSGRPAEAARALDALEGIAPGDPVAWHERAIALGAAGQVDEAARAERRAIALDPSLPEPHNHLGALLARRGDAPGALEEFTRATSLDPNNASAWTNRANALRALGRRAEAAEGYRAAARLAPRDAGPMNGLGVMAVEDGDAEGAAALFTQALAVDPSYDEARLNLAVADAKRGDTAAARAALQELLRRRPEPTLAARATALLRDLGGS